MIYLKRGSIFDEKCDLLIIPCNNFGGVSGDILDNLMTYDLPYYCENMRAGDVKFYENIGSFANASYLGFAASVNEDSNDSIDTKLAVKRICLQIKDYALINEIRKINIPLLGTGAGKLRPADSYKIIYEELNSESNLDVYVYVLNIEMYSEIQGVNNTIEKPKDIKPPRVFISYTGADENNRKWVKEFATRLRKNGVDARIDIFHLKPGQDLPQWMTKEILLADKVILICDKNYAKKADTKKGGAGWETMIIQGDMLVNLNQTKYICIVREEKIENGLPIYMNSRFSYVWNNEEKYQQEFDELLLNLFDCNNPPPLGNPPDFIRHAYNNRDL